MMDALENGIKIFNGGRYFEAHETWEDLWRETDGKDKLFYQGLVQVAVGLHHLSGGTSRGGRRVLARGLDKLESYPKNYLGIDNGGFTVDARRTLEDLDADQIRIRRC